MDRERPTVAASPDPRRLVPATNTVLADPRLAQALISFGRDRVREAVRTAQQQVREGKLQPDEVTTAAVRSLTDGVSAVAVINATGVLLHTNLGRARLSAQAGAALAVAAGTTDVELDLGTGRRGPRGAATLSALLAKVSAAQAAHLTNNNAAALVLCATALARGREIVIARGELIEIGDGFRLPDLLTSTGARLREVGTTNRVHVRDYLDALGPDTGFVLKVHPSNYVVRGFTQSVGVRELAAALRSGGYPLVHDIGSGLLQPHPGLPDEPDAQTSLAAGTAVVTASADKLLGGPQAGVLLGRADLLETLRRHPLARALRVDKLTLAALHATLAGSIPPLAQWLSETLDDRQARAGRLGTLLAEVGVHAPVIASTAAVGGGGAPEVSIPSAAVRLPQGWATRLRTGRPAVLGRLHDGTLLLDVAALTEADLADIVTAVQTVADGVRSCT